MVPQIAARASTSAVRIQRNARRTPRLKRPFRHVPQVSRFEVRGYNTGGTVGRPRLSWDPHRHVNANRFGRGA